MCVCVVAGCRYGHSIFYKLTRTDTLQNFFVRQVTLAQIRSQLALKPSASSVHLALNLLQPVNSKLVYLLINILPLLWPWSNLRLLSSEICVCCEIARRCLAYALISLD